MPSTLENDWYGSSLGSGKRDLWERWMAEEAAFFAADGTRDRADIVVDTSAAG